MQYSISLLPLLLAGSVAFLAPVNNANYNTSRPYLPGVPMAHDRQPTLAGLTAMVISLSQTVEDLSAQIELIYSIMPNGTINGTVYAGDNSTGYYNDTSRVDGDNMMAKRSREMARRHVR